MKFLLTMSANYLREEDVEKYQKIGFKFEKIDNDKDYFYGKYEKIDKKVYIEIETLEELINLKSSYGNLILKDDWKGRYEIEIY